MMVICTYLYAGSNKSCPILRVTVTRTLIIASLPRLHAFRTKQLFAVKSRSVIHHCVVILSGPQGSRSVHVCGLHLKMEFTSCARGRQWCGIIHYYC